MKLEFAILSFSLIGIWYFFVNLKDVKGYFSTFAGYIGLVFVIYLVMQLWSLLVYDHPTSFRELFVNVVVFTRNTILAAVGKHFLVKLVLPSAPILFHFNKMEGKWISYLKACFGALFLMVAVSTILLVISSSTITKSQFPPIVDIVTLSFQAFLVSVSEEIFSRLFLQSLFMNWFGKTRCGVALSIVMVSSIWALSHPGIIETDGIKFIQIFLLGIILGVLMLKKGVECCCVAHTVFNIVAYVFLAGFQPV